MVADWLEQVGHGSRLVRASAFVGQQGIVDYCI